MAKVAAAIRKADSAPAGHRDLRRCAAHSRNACHRPRHAVRAGGDAGRSHFHRARIRRRVRVAGQPDSPDPCSQPARRPANPGRGACRDDAGQGLRLERPCVRGLRGQSAKWHAGQSDRAIPRAEQRLRRSGGHPRGPCRPYRRRRLATASDSHGRGQKTVRRVSRGATGRPRTASRRMREKFFESTTMGRRRETTRGPRPSFLPGTRRPGGFDWPAERAAVCG